jgi:hypothetical protein
MAAISQVSNLAMGLLFLRAGTRLGLQSATAQEAQLDDAEQQSEAAVASPPPSKSASARPI